MRTFVLMLLALVVIHGVKGAEFSVLKVAQKPLPPEQRQVPTRLNPAQLAKRLFKLIKTEQGRWLHENSKT